MAIGSVPGGPLGSIDASAVTAPEPTVATAVEYEVVHSVDKDAPPPPPGPPLDMFAGMADPTVMMSALNAAGGNIAGASVSASEPSIVEADCRGVLGGTAKLDLCFICEGDNTTCLDCNGVPMGRAREDRCGVCDDDFRNNCRIDCEGVWGGGLVLDACMVCNGTNDCADCAGRPYGRSRVDMCGTCDANMANDCARDCNGTWGGPNPPDICGICGGNGSTCNYGIVPGMESGTSFGASSIPRQSTNNAPTSNATASDSGVSNFLTTLMFSSIVLRLLDHIAFHENAGTLFPGLSNAAFIAIVAATSTILIGGSVTGYLLHTSSKLATWDPTKLDGYDDAVPEEIEKKPRKMEAVHLREGRSKKTPDKSREIAAQQEHAQSPEAEDDPELEEFSLGDSSSSSSSSDDEIEDMAGAGDMVRVEDVEAVYSDAAYNRIAEEGRIPVLNHLLPDP
eukprot:SAG31_NODE_1947_length_6840_cov_4.654206_2_plen_452_part_00